MAKLVIRAGRSVGQEFKLNAARMVIGRRSANPIPISDPKASREHAVVHVRGEHFYVQDLSRNGTLVAGRPALKEEAGSLLTFGERIQIGDTELELVDEKSEKLDLEIPGYQVLEKVGMGGMGTVYKARQLSMDRVVALKVLNERYSNNAEFVDRFKLEARAAGKLNHPNVIHVHDIAKANGRHFFSMEFVDGQSVKDLLRAEKTVEVNRALDIVLQAARALEYAHENRIVHRDIKPDNIMLTREGIVKIADLGIAKTFEESAPSVKEQRRVMGTPHYMAPEQALGKPIDHRVDIYSLGATFYHMITGSTPFQGQTAHAILKAHIQESLPPIQEMNSAVPDPVCFVIERMMAKMPEKRYPTMAKVIEDIERIQRGNIKGIDRIEAGESTILRALNGKKKEAAPENGAPQPGDTSVAGEEPTGAQPQVSKGLVAAGLILVFIAVVAAVVVVVPKLTGTTPPNQTDQTGQPGAGTTPPDASTGTPPGQGTAPAAGRSHPEALKLLSQAKAAEAQTDLAGAEVAYRQIRERFPASEEAVEAAKRLDALVAAAKAAERKRAEDLLAAAKAAEADPAAAIAKYRAAIDAARSVPDVLATAQARVKELEQRLAEDNARAVDAAWNGARDTAITARAKYDYDSARAALDGFLKTYNAAAQAEEARKLLERVNTDAQTRFKDAQASAATSDIPGSLRVWTDYGAQVKDAQTVAQVGEAIAAINAKADQLATEELNKAGEAARRYDYDGAAKIMEQLRKKLSGLPKWDAIVRANEQSVDRQKKLHARVLELAAQKVKSGPVELPFPLKTSFTDLKGNWRLERAEADRIVLRGISANGPFGTQRKFVELTPQEQYQVVTFLLGPQPSADEHRALAAFCAQRDLNDEATVHEQKAGQ